jgi:hypothetical protein
VVLSVDEKSQIQALDRTHLRPAADDPPAEQRRPSGRRGPGLPMKKGRAGTLTHD